MPFAPTLFADPGPMPQGFRYQEGLLSSDQEAELSSWIATLDLKPFEFHGYLGNRRIACEIAV